MSVLQFEEEDDELRARMGLDRFAAGGGFNLSVMGDTVDPAGFFTFSEPE